MSYAASVLQPGERIVVMGRLHWIVYWNAIVLAILGLFLIGWERATEANATLTEMTAVVFVVMVFVALAAAWFKRWITEIAVTDRRVIYKTGFITRHTVEINMDKVASVDVDQSILGRMLDYGTVQVIGTGSASSEGGVRGIEDLKRIAHPLALRSAITAK